jgi:dihydroxy-acid dehydratase
VIKQVDAPIKKSGGLVILKGTLAPEGCVIKGHGIEKKIHTGPARVFDREEDAMDAVMAGAIKAGDVVVIRYERAEGRSRYARDAGRYRRHRGRRSRRVRGAAHRRPLQRLQRADSASGTSRRKHSTAARSPRFRMATRSPSTSPTRGSISICLRRTIAARLAAVKKPAPKYTRGVFAKYIASVGSASRGAVTD